MQERFKKNKGLWMEQFLKAVVTRSILRQPLDPPDPSKPSEPLFISRSVKQYSFQTKGSEKIINPPELLLNVDPELGAQLLDKATRTRNTIQAFLVADSPDSPITRLQETFPEEEDLGTIQHSKDAFCIGLSLIRDEGIGKTRERVQHQFRSLTAHSGVRHPLNEQKGHLVDIWNLLSQFIRIFFLVEERERKLKIGRLLFFPKVDISIRKVKITPCSFVDNPTFKKISQMNFAKQTYSGYISLNCDPKTGAYKFYFIDHHDYQQQKQPVSLFGVFLAGRLGGPQKQQTLQWTIIVEYLTNPCISRRFSLKGNKTGIFASFDEKGRHCLYIFEVIGNPTWSISTSIETSQYFPQEHRMTTREVIMEEEKEESEVESVQSRPNLVEFPDKYPPDSCSSRSIDDKDQQIAALKAELESKNKECQMLRQIVFNLSQKSTAPPYPMPMMNGYHHSNPHQQILNTSEEQFQLEPQFGLPFEPSHKEEPRAKYGQTKDARNFSFAKYENSYEEEPNIQNIVSSIQEEQTFSSPQFKQLKDWSERNKQIKPFQQKGRQEELPHLPNPIKKTQTLPQVGSADSPKHLKSLERHRSDPPEQKSKKTESATRKEKTYESEREPIDSQKYSNTMNKYVSSPKGSKVVHERIGESPKPNNYFESKGRQKERKFGEKQAKEQKIKKAEKPEASKKSSKKEEQNLRQKQQSGSEDEQLDSIMKKYM